MAAGAGYYVGATATTALVLVSLVGLRQLRPTLLSRLRTDLFLLEVQMSDQGELGDVFNVLGKRGVQVRSMESERDEHEHVFRLELLVPAEVNLDATLADVRRLPGVRAAEAQATGSPQAARRLAEE
jgi:putative Mg2+ transporter-C (MgtC) family protein